MTHAKKLLGTVKPARGIKVKRGSGDTMMHACVQVGTIATLIEQGVGFTRWQKNQNGTLNDIKGDVRLIDDKVTRIETILNERDKADTKMTDRERNVIALWGVKISGKLLAIAVLTVILNFVVTVVLPFGRQLLDWSGIWPL